jgi:hypothetical protein
MKTVCVVRTVDDERELVIVGIPTPEPTFAVLSVRIAAPPGDSEPRVVTYGPTDPEETRRAALEHAREVADLERGLARARASTCATPMTTGATRWACRAKASSTTS